MILPSDLERFEDITCVEASDEAINEAMRQFPSPHYFHSRFEDANLPNKYDNIIMTHVLEHIDDPVAVLSCVNRLAK